MASVNIKNITEIKIEPQNNTEEKLDQEVSIIYIKVLIFIK